MLKAARAKFNRDKHFDSNTWNAVEWKCITEFMGENKVIQSLVFPMFQMYLFNDSQLDMVRELHRKKGLVIGHFDATGNVVQNPSMVETVLFLYSMVINDSKFIFNVFEGLLTVHSSFAISNLLRFFINSLTKRHKFFHDRLIFHEIVVDFCMAEVNAVLDAFNSGLKFVDYIEITFKILSENDRGKLLTITSIHLCSSHFAKMIIKDIRACYGKKNKETVNLVAELVGGLVDLPFYQDAVEYWKNFVVVLSERYKTAEFYSALYSINDDKLSLENLIDESEFIDTDLKIKEHSKIMEIDFEFDETVKSLYQKSKFYQYFKSFIPENSVTGFDEASMTATPGQETNSLFNRKFLDMFTEKCISVFPMWSKTLRALRRNTTLFDRANNGNIERYFGLKKRNLRGNTSTKLGTMRVDDYAEKYQNQIEAESKIFR